MILLALVCVAALALVLVCAAALASCALSRRVRSWGIVHRRRCRRCVQYSLALLFLPLPNHPPKPTDR